MPPPDRSAISPRSRLDALINRAPRYTLVSVANVIFGQALLFVALTALDTAPRWLVTAGVGIICAAPTYYLHRRWVWGRSGKSSLRREIGPFWLFVFVGLGASTVGVGIAEWAWGLSHLTPLPAIIANAISFGTIGVVWFVRFFWMDHAFRPPIAEEDPHHAAHE